MHACLQLPELVHTICEALGSEPASLYSMSLTCRRFSKSALDCLWYELHSLKPLLCTLPEESLLRDLTIDDVARFASFYSRRIRKLKLDRASGYEPSLDLFQELQDLNIGILTPNLTCLHWYSEYLWEFEGVFSFISLFLGPNLRDIGVHMHPENTDHQNLVLTVANGYPNLQALKVTFGNPASSIECWDEGNSICRFNHLRSLAVPHLSAKTLDHLSRLPSLQEIYMSDFRFPVAAPRYSGSDRGRFPSLEKFVVVAGSVSLCSNLIRYLSPTSPLRRFSLTYSGEAEVQIPPLLREWQEVLHRIGEHCNPDTLVRLELHDSDYLDPDVLLPAPTIAAEGDIEKIEIEPLFALKRLEVLEISFAHGLFLTKADLQRIPTHWKSIAYMYLGSNYPAFRAPAINHEDLVILVNACPKLWGLGLIFDTTGMPENPTLLLGKPIKRFQQIGVGNSPILSVEAMSQFLGMHFPRLAEVIPCGAVETFLDSAELSRRWSEVGERLREAILERRRARAAVQ